MIAKLEYNILKILLIGGIYMTLSLYTQIAALSALITLLLIPYSLKRKSYLGIAFPVTLALIFLWIIAQILELRASFLETKLFWANVQYIPILFIPVCFLFLIFYFTNSRHLQNKMIFLMLSMVPVLGNVLVWTNPRHSLIRENVFLNDSGPIALVGKDYGIGFWFLAAYNYSLCLFMFYILFHSLRDKSLIYRKQVNFFALGVLLPVLTNIYNLSGLNPLGFDLTPLAFGASGIILYFGIIKFEIFDMVPIARSFIVDEIKSGVVVTDRTGKIVDINKAARGIFEAEEKDILGQKGKDVFSPYPELIQYCGSKEEKVFNFEIERQGDIKTFEVSLTPLNIAGKEYLGCILLLRDISEKKKAEEKIAFAASHDYLTGLPNRYFFIELYEKEISQAKRRNDSFAIVYVDLDGFKKVNDLYGHDVGDFFLRHVSHCLLSVIREGDIVSRFGGDEFVILLTDVKDKSDIEKVIERIFSRFSEGCNINGAIVPIKASIGVSIYPDDGNDTEVLLKKADEAMYLVKNTQERNSWKFFS